MTQKSRTHVFKILTPITASVEKIINLHGLKQVYRPRNINVLFSQCITMALQCISPKVTVKDFKKCCISNAWMGPMVCCGMMMKRTWVLGLSMTKMHALTVKMETVTMMGKGR
jgi:hypothetical protein